VISPGWDIAPFARRTPISPGVRGTVETLGLMSDLVGASLLDPLYPLFVRRKVLAETGVDPRDIPAVFARAYDYWKANVGYQRDPLVLGSESVTDYVQSPHWSLFVEGYGDCLAHAGGMASFAVSLGHGYGYRTLRADESDPSRFSHVYAILGYKDAAGRDVWLPADTTLPHGSLGDELPNVERYSPHDFIVVPTT